MSKHRKKWSIKKSKHFIFKYPHDTPIELEIDEIIKKREFAYEKISSFLQVKADRPITLYFSPSYEYCYVQKMVAQAAVPHKYFASLVYDEFPLCHEKIKYGHEITHLLVYFWDKKNIIWKYKRCIMSQRCNSNIISRS